MVSANAAVPRANDDLPLVLRAIQRDEQEIEQWRVEVWPRLKAEARRERRALVFVDESGFYLLPGKVRTYAPEGNTPILHEWQTRDHLSVRARSTPWCVRRRSTGCTPSSSSST